MQCDICGRDTGTRRVTVSTPTNDICDPQTGVVHPAHTGERFVRCSDCRAFADEFGGRFPDGVKSNVARHVRTH